MGCSSVRYACMRGPICNQAKGQGTLLPLPSENFMMLFLFLKKETSTFPKGTLDYMVRLWVDVPPIISFKFSVLQCE